ncbi:MAG: alpha/beta fold hydrolase [Gammaproteobacteria bacterium]
MEHNPGPTSHSYFSQRMRLHYVDWGNQDAPPLVLVHGGRDHCRNWDWVAQALKKDWHVIAPDLRGHGDSDWTSDGNYRMGNYIYDLAQLIHQQDLAPVTLVAHSLGGNIALRYAGLYPELVSKVVAIEGLGFSPQMMAERAKKSFEQRMREWVEEQRQLAARLPRRYPSIEDAFKRMQGENKHLSPDQARHLTVHGVNQNEDGTYSWKFDNYVRSWPPYDMPQADVEKLWSLISCPTCLVHGEESWASNPAEDGRAKHFQNARIESFENAGHWVHHDRLEGFIELLHDFL